MLYSIDCFVSPLLDFVLWKRVCIGFACCPIAIHLIIQYNMFKINYKFTFYIEFGNKEIRFLANKFEAFFYCDLEDMFQEWTLLKAMYEGMHYASL